jgi:hypothetical protein
MNRFAVALGLALAVGAVLAVPAAAQARVAIQFGFGLPRPDVAGVIVVGPRYAYEAEPEVRVAPRPWRYWHRYPFDRERGEYRIHRHQRRHWHRGHAGDE